MSMRGTPWDCGTAANIVPGARSSNGMSTPIPPCGILLTNGSLAMVLWLLAELFGIFLLNLGPGFRQDIYFIG